MVDLGGLFALAAGLFGAVVLHEAGHLLAAIANDFEVVGVVVGPFRAVRLGTAWKLLLKTHRLFEASISAFPRTTENWKQRMMTVVAAGPVSTLVTGLLAAVALHAFGTGDNWLVWLLRAFTQVSFFIFVLGLVPNHKSLPCQNDAALFRSLWTNHPQAQEIFLYHLVLQQQARGVRPRNYPVGLIQLLAEFQGRTDFMAFFATTIALWAFDSNDNETGNSWDRRALDLCAQGGFQSRNLCTVNSACFDMIYRENPTSARAKLDQLDLRGIVSLQLRYRASAVAHLAGGRVPEALAIIARAGFTLPEHLKKFGVEHLLLTHLHAKALAKQPEEIFVKIQKPKTGRFSQTSLSRSAKVLQQISEPEVW